MFVLIAIISYIYEKFTMKNVFQLVTIYFVMETLEFVLLQPVMFETTSDGQVVTPLIGIIAALIYFVLLTIAIFVSVETVIQNNLGEGTKKGLYLLWARSSILWAYLLVWAIVFFTSFIIQYFVILGYRLTHIMPSVLSSSMMPTIMIIVTLLGDAYLVFTTFKLACIFGNKESEKKTQESSGQTTDTLSSPNETQA